MSFGEDREPIAPGDYRYYEPAKPGSLHPVGSTEVLACPWCGEPDYDLAGLKSHVIKGECEVFESTETIQSPFDGLLPRQAIDQAHAPANELNERSREEKLHAEVFDPEVSDLEYFQSRQKHHEAKHQSEKGQR